MNDQRIIMKTKDVTPEILHGGIAEDVVGMAIDFSCRHVDPSCVYLACKLYIFMAENEARTEEQERDFLWSEWKKLTRAQSE